MGKCEYVLAKDSMYNWFEIRETNEACNGGQVACTKSLTILFRGLTIKLGRGTVSVNNTAVTLPNTSGGMFCLFGIFFNCNKIK